MMNRRKGYVAAGIVVAITTTCSGCSSVASARHQDAQYAAAAHAYDEGDLSSAEALYRSLLKAHPGYEEGWFKLGNIYVRTNQLDAAVRMYKAAVRLNVEDERAWSNLALARVKQAVAALDEGKSHQRAGGEAAARMENLRERIVASVLKEH